MTETIAVNFGSATAGATNQNINSNLASTTVTELIGNWGTNQNLNCGSYYWNSWPYYQSLWPLPVNLRGNILDEDSEYTISLDVPGVKGKHVTAEITDRTLTVSVDFGEQIGTGDRLSGVQTRIFYLPADIKTKSCSATLEDGVLSLVFSKDAKPKTHKITIESK